LHLGNFFFESHARNEVVYTLLDGERRIEVGSVGG
jgi:hypothetical protein